MSGIINSAGSKSGVIGTKEAASLWRVHTEATGDVNPILNWERDDSSGYGQLGNVMVESSGIFTFPYIGIWKITFACSVRDAGSNSSRYIEGSIHRTLNDATAGTYAEVTRATGCMYSLDSNSDYMTTNAEYLFDVDDLSNDKVRFSVSVSDNDNVLHGNSTQNYTWATFIRISDTQGGG